MRTDATQPGQLADLTHCDKEPIHIPGRIQAHGVLLVLREPALTLVQVSENVADFLGISVGALLGQPLRSFLREDQLAPLLECLHGHGLTEPVRRDLVLRTPTGERLFDAILHRHGGALILELEPFSRQDDAAALVAPYQQAREALARLKAATSLDELYRIAASAVRRLTGFDRVLIYQFDPEGNGEIVAEERDASLDAFLGLHYPASDIPRQARQLYLRNWLRLIPDAHRPTAALVPALHPDTRQPLDLSVSILRAVSPVHIEYLNNLGLRASMSISLIRANQLWGLISCGNHQGPKHVPHDLRVACELVGQVLSLRISLLEEAEFARERMRLRWLTDRLTEQMAVAVDFRDGLLRHQPNLGELFESSGAALCFGGECSRLGRTPSEDELWALARWLDANVRLPVFHTHALSRLFPAAERYKDMASGLLAIRVSRHQSHYVLWFRPEIIQTVTWGGDPRKPVEFGPDGPRLHPRKSFARWKELVQDQSRPWLAQELEAAHELRRAIMDADLKRQVLHEQEARAEAEEARRLLASLTEAIPQMVWSTDPLGNPDFYNSLWFEKTGCSLDAARGQGWAQVLHPEDRQRTLHAWLEATRTVRDFDIEHRFRMVDGSYRWQLSRALPVRGPDGQVTRWFGTSTDIDDQKRAEEERSRAILAREEILAMVSHDLKNPLGVILLSTALMRRSKLEGEQGEQLRGHLEKVQRAAERMNSLIRDILDLARIEAGHFFIEPVPHPPFALMDEAIELLLPLAAQKGLRLERYGWSEPLGPVSCDRERILQVFSNLLGNAIKFTPAGGEVLVSAEPGEGSVRFSVKDTGPGIPPEQLPHLFDRYWQARDKARMGSGLGLFISRGIIAAHGGHIWVDSTVGVGSTFSFTLPLESAHDRPLGTSQPG
ncbi:ATP-binding protein [Cystobacter fuscus]|uniref:ATP-binding protein n=1 Tax=Cystobacter fuscus TaxID=43 RepID=UPI002B2FF61E|nr:PAS domain-containing protein [Cystobacter fuscus]